MRAFIVTLALAGMLVSSLALRAHYTEDIASTLSSSHCKFSYATHSYYSAVAGIPVAAFGIVGYATVGLLAFFRRRTLTSIFSLFCLATLTI